MLAHRDLLHVVGHGAGLEPLERHAAIMQIDGMPAAMAVKLACECSMPVEASSTLKSDFIMARTRRMRVVVVGRTAFEQRDRRLRAELGEVAWTTCQTR